MMGEDDCCDLHNPDLSIVDLVRENCCGADTMADLAAVFKLMGDPVRIRILHALSISDMCVCDLAELLEMSHSAVSHQLRLLRTARMARYEKHGRRAVYRLSDRYVEIVMRTALDHMKGEGCPPDKEE